MTRSRPLRARAGAGASIPHPQLHLSEVTYHHDPPHPSAVLSASQRTTTTPNATHTPHPPHAPPTHHPRTTHRIAVACAPAALLLKPGISCGRKQWIGRFKSDQPSGDGCKAVTMTYARAKRAFNVNAAPPALASGQPAGRRRGAAPSPIAARWALGFCVQPDAHTHHPTTHCRALLSPAPHILPHRRHLPCTPCLKAQLHLDSTARRFKCSMKTCAIQGGGGGGRVSSTRGGGGSCAIQGGRPLRTTGVGGSC
jgi:hypothetical protein